ncbi:MAG TPA: glycoside-pentoside-hexuronide (GPH):cation symporter [Patescibacteria group bacterium]|nr:glycoside-pentoside-hexuronide (GPH):cation symporter [Patescibacteria group bacterium]
MGKSTVATNASGLAESGKVKLSEKIAYGIGNFGEQMVFNPATTFMVFFYTDVAGIAPATVGTLLFASQFLGVLNPVMGAIVDRTNTRFGKARPWLLWMAVPFGIAAALLFRSPDISYAGKVIFAVITYNLAFTLFYTPVDVPYATMLPFMTTNQHERTSLSVFRMSFAFGGVLLTFVLTMPLVKFFGGGAPGWGRAFMLFGAIATASLLFCFAGTRERFHVTGRWAKSAVPLKVAVPGLFRNKYLVLIGALHMLTFLGLGLWVANLYYLRYFLHKASLFGPLMAAQTVAEMVTMVFTPAITRRYGKRNAILAGLAVTIAGQLLLFITPLTFTLLAVGTVIKGLGAGPLVGTSFAMVADTLEYGDWKLNLRNDGLAFGAMSLVMKSSIGFSNAMVGWILGLGGYIGKATVQTASALESIKIVFLYMPLLFFGLSVVVMLVYDLDKRYPAIEADLRERRAAAAATGEEP